MTGKKGKLPAFLFYTGDWMKDPNLRRCSRAARGMWADMLCLMFECEDRGMLLTGGVPWSDEDIAAASGGDISEGLQCIAELLRKGVAHRNQSGAIFSRRMVRDEQKRRAGGERVKKHRHKGDCNDDVTLKKRRSNNPSSVSVSSSPSGDNVSCVVAPRAREPDTPHNSPEPITEEFLAQLQTTSAYVTRGIVVRHVLEKLQLDCQTATPPRSPTRRELVRWCNNERSPPALRAEGRQTTSRAAPVTNFEQSMAGADECQTISIDEWQECVASLVEVQGSPPADLIARLPVSADEREWLLASFESHDGKQATVEKAMMAKG